MPFAGACVIVNARLAAAVSTSAPLRVTVFGVSSFVEGLAGVADADGLSLTGLTVIETVLVYESSAAEQAGAGPSTDQDRRDRSPCR